MKKHSSWKKTAAFLMALALVTGGLPANAGGFWKGGTAIVASAATTVDGVTFNDTWSSNNSIPMPEWDEYTYATSGRGSVPKARQYSMSQNIQLNDTLYCHYYEYAVVRQSTYGYGIVKKCAVREYPKSWIGRYQAA